MSNTFRLILFLVLVVGGGSLIGYLTAPGAWYDGLNKPGFTPPGWLFGPVWTALYVMIAIAGWRVWTRQDGTALKGVWALQMGLNFLWSPVFFAAENPALALVIIAALLIAILSFIALAWRRDRVAALLFLPYAAWVGFATLLNASIAAMN